jgi:hypothetical protein
MRILAGRQYMCVDYFIDYIALQLSRIERWIRDFRTA